MREILNECSTRRQLSGGWPVTAFETYLTYCFLKSLFIFMTVDFGVIVTTLYNWEIAGGALRPFRDTRPLLQETA